MFNSLRLSVVVTGKIATEIATEALTEAEAIDANYKNLYVIGAQSLIESIRALLLRQELTPKYYL